MARVQVEFAGKQFTGDSLSPKELAILHHHLDDYLAAGSSFLYDLFRLNLPSIEAAAAVAKDKFSSEFNGILAADNQIGFQHIRPGQILRTTGTTETPVNSWSFSFAVTTDYWVGFSTNNTTAAHVDKECLLLPLGIAFTQGADPVVEELIIQVGETVYPVQVIRNAWLADNVYRVRATRIHPILIEPRQTVLIQTTELAAGTNEMVLLGLAFGFGRFLRSASYTAVAL